MLRVSTSDTSLAQSQLSVQEQVIYGSSRLGLTNVSYPAEDGWYERNSYSTLRGFKQYELTNHLGNVLATVSDLKKPVASVSDPGSIGYYEALVTSAGDYYPFGMMMPGRQAAGSYRFGFNGKENDGEVKGSGNQYDYGFRIYDSRIGRFLSVDPLTKEYPWNSTYAFAENDVIRSIDLEGAEKHVQTFYFAGGKDGTTVSKVVSNDYVQAAGTFNLGTLIGHPPITDEQEAARYIVQYHRYPTDGTFSFFEFAPELDKQKYARYDYKDKTGKTQSAYFSQEIVDKTFEGYRTSHARNAKILNAYASLVNLAGSGVLLKSELKAATEELKTSTSTSSALKGSGSVSGVIELNSSIKSSKAFSNGLSTAARDFVYDPTTQKFAMAGNNAANLKHYGLRQVIGATEVNVVGGRIKLGANGEILTSQWSGTYGGNWTSEISTKFKEFIKTTTTKEVKHSGTSKFIDGTQ